ncbi:MAG: GIY-YIG nuclease family protein [Flavobacteriaceae bacterium]|nr:GIY-YIG nuclease family protein [Flavobacteriaceae bacterium]
MTSNLDKRLSQHNAGKNRSTKVFVPWRVIFKENFDIRIEARKKEKYLKSGAGREFIKNFV